MCTTQDSILTKILRIARKIMITNYDVTIILHKTYSFIGSTNILLAGVFIDDVECHEYIVQLDSKTCWLDYVSRWLERKVDIKSR